MLSFYRELTFISCRDVEIPEYLHRRWDEGTSRGPETLPDECHFAIPTQAMLRHKISGTQIDRIHTNMLTSGIGLHHPDPPCLGDGSAVVKVSSGRDIFRIRDR